MTQPPLFEQSLTLSQLESHLWEAANILRGSPVDRTDWKSYILPLLFYGTGLAACILIFRRRKDPARAGQVLIVDASGQFRKGRAQNFLEAEHAADILGWYSDFADVKDRARVVSVEEIAEEDWTLNISRYVSPHIGEDIPPLDEAIADFKAALERVREAEKNLRQVMTEGGWLDD